MTYPEQLKPILEETMKQLAAGDNPAPTIAAAILAGYLLGVDHGLEAGKQVGREEGQLHARGDL